MTSEGQHAGQQAEATSGAGGTEQASAGPVYGTPRAAGEFPPDLDNRPPSGSASAPQTGWGPDAYPNSYGPPSYPPSGGSPFVVPAVPVFGTPNGDAHLPGSARPGEAGQSSGHPGASLRRPDSGGDPVATPRFAPSTAPEQDHAPSIPPVQEFTQPDRLAQPDLVAQPDRAVAVPPEAWAPINPTPNRPTDISWPAASTPVQASPPVQASYPMPGDHIDQHGVEPANPFDRAVGSSSVGDSAGAPDDDPLARPVEPHPYRQAQAPAGSEPAPFAATEVAHPYGGGAGAHPYRSSSVVSGSAAVPPGPAQPSFRPGSDERPHRPAEDGPAQRTPVSTAQSAAGGPLPSRADRPPFGGPDGPGNPDATSGFNGFVTPSAGSPPGRTKPEVPIDPDSSDGRQPGISAFGGQRVRVPGAALSDLPDAPPAIQAGRPTDSGGFHLRGGPDVGADGPPARQTSNGLPVRGSGSPQSFPAPDSTSFGPAAEQDSGRFGPGQPAAFSPGQAAPFSPGLASEAHSGQAPEGFGARQDVSGFGPRPEVSGFGPGADAPAQAVAAPRGPVFGSVPADALPAVPQPRTPADPPVDRPAEAPAVGTARPVSASASVPVASRVPPPADGDELPPPAASRQPRIYGRAPQPENPTTPDPAGADAAAPQPAFPSAAPSAGFRSALPDDLVDNRRIISGQGGMEPVGTRRINGHDVNGNDVNGIDVNGNDPHSHDPHSHDPHSHDRDGHDGRGRTDHGTDSTTGDDQTDTGRWGGEGNSPDGAAQSAFRPGPESAPPGGPPTGRASASARVTPPSAGAQPFTPGSPAGFGTAPADRDGFGTAPADHGGFGTAPADRGGLPFSEPTTDVSKRGRNAGPPAADHLGAPGDDAPPWAKPYGAGNTSVGPYSEHTTDMAGRAPAVDQPYVPAPALPSMHAAPPGVDGFPPGVPPDQQSGRRPTRPELSGLFPPSNRATVTPPGSPQTATWAAPSDQTEQSRFEAFKPEDATAAPAPAPEKAEQPHVRLLPVVIGVILAAVLVVGVPIGVVWLMARPNGSGFDVDAGQCVKRDGDKAVTATCGEPGTFEVVSKVGKKEDCADPTQPYVEAPNGDGRTQVLCLKLSS